MGESSTGIGDFFESFEQKNSISSIVVKLETISIENELEKISRESDRSTTSEGTVLHYSNPITRKRKLLIMWLFRKILIKLKLYSYRDNLMVKLLFS